MSRLLSLLLAALAAAALALPADGETRTAGTAGRAPRVGLVLQPPGTDDAFGGIAYVGFRRAVRDFDLEGRALTPSLREGYFPSFARLARQRYDLVLGVGFLQAEAADAAALRFPKTKFAIVDVSVSQLEHRRRNFRGIVFATQEGGYLAGYLAALLEKRRPGKDVISAVGGLKIPPVDAFIAGYRAGARRASPGITVLVGYSKDFLDTAKCEAIAADQIARGSGAVFQVAGACGLGALEAARKRGVWGIGVDTDQAALGPHILTSVVKRMDVAVYATIEELVRGTFTSGRDSVFTVANGGVGLGKVNPRVPRSVLVQVARVREQIARGLIDGIPASLA